MAKIEGRATVTLSMTFTFDEEEMRAWDALAGYGDDNFIKQFYKVMGETYLRPHEAGLRRLFAAIRSASYHLKQTEVARRAYDKKLKPSDVEYIKRCHAARDGDCIREDCPQVRDGEPGKSGRHCPLDSRDVDV